MKKLCSLSSIRALSNLTYNIDFKNISVNINVSKEPLNSRVKYCVFQFFKGSHNSVSYTHLDVYKRQLVPCPCSLMIMNLKSSGFFISRVICGLWK